MKLKVFLFLFTLINASLAFGQENFIKLCQQTESSDSNIKNSMRALKYFYKTQDCQEIANKIAKLKSFNEFAPPGIHAKKPAKLLFPWTDDFPYLYGVRESYFKMTVEEGRISPFSGPQDFSNLEMYKSLDIFSEFKNIRAVTLTSDYNYFNNPSFNVCSFIAKFPHLKIVTIESKLLLDPAIDNCLSKSNLDGVILRDHFSGYDGKLPKTKIIGIEFYKGDIEDLAQYLYLQYLGISNEAKTLESLEALASLGLTHFSMNINSIKDISEIKILENLSYLNLTCIDNEKNASASDKGCKEGHYLKDLNFLKHMIYLEHLNLSFSNIKDINIVSELNQLKYLKVRGNSISDISGLATLPKLTYLDLSGNNLSRINNISTFPEVKFLNLSGNQINDFSALKDLKNLEYINLSNNSSISSLAGSDLPDGLKGLNLNGGGGSAFLDEKDLEKYKAYYSQSIDHDQYYQFETLFHDYGSKNDSQKNVCTVYPMLTEMPDLSHLNRLELLSLKNNKLLRMPDLKDFAKLKFLSLGRNRIQNFSQDSLPLSLQHLNLGVNLLISFPEVSALKNLKTIELISNNISSLDNILTLPASVNKVGLRNNLLTDVSLVSKVTTNERTLVQGFDVSGNPYSRHVFGGTTLSSGKIDLVKHESEKCPDSFGM